MMFSAITMHWKKTCLLTIMLTASGMLFLLQRINFDLAPDGVDMTGEAAMQNLRVAVRNEFFIRSVILFFVAAVTSTGVLAVLYRLRSGEALVNMAGKFAAVSVFFLLQQVLANSTAFFFLLFFTVAILTGSLLLLFHFWRRFSEEIALFAGLIAAVFFTHSVLWLELLFAAELLLFFLYRNSTSKWMAAVKNAELQKQAFFSLSAGAISFLLFFLLLLFRVDLFDVVQYIQWEKRIPRIVLLMSLIPVLAFVPVYLLLRNKYSHITVAYAGWCSFALLFITAQFADNYLPVLLMMLISLAMLASVKEGKILEYYSLAADLLLCLGLFYLLNLIGSVTLHELSGYLLPVLFALFVFLRRQFVKTEKTVVFYTCLLPLMATALLLFITQELFMILNQHNIYPGKRGFVLLLSIAYGFFFLFLFFWKPVSFKKVITVGYAAGIAGIALYNSYNPVWLGGVDFFEDASAAVAVKRIYLNGELPVFEHFSPHNLNDFITGLLYALLNNDVSPGYKIYNCFYALFFVVYYSLLSVLFKSRLLGFVWTLFSGVLWIMLPIYHAIAVLSFMNLFWYFSNRPSFFRTVLCAAVFLFTVFFRADTGIALLLPLIAATPFFVKQYKLGGYKLKRLLVTVFCLLALVVLAVYWKPGAGPALLHTGMIMDYLDSAQSWGYSFLSRIYSFKFRAHYFIFPVLVLAGLLYLLLGRQYTCKQLNFVKLCCLFFALYYLINYPRGLVRHSFAEAKDVNVASYIYFLAGLFAVLLFLKKGHRFKLVGLFLFAVTCSIWLFKFPRTFENRSLYTAAIDRIRTDTDLPFAAEKVKRYDPEKNAAVQKEAYEIFVYSRIDQLRNLYKSRAKKRADIGGIDFYSRTRFFLQPMQQKEDFFPELSRLKATGVVNGVVDEVCYKPMVNYFINEHPVHLFNQGVHAYHTKKLQQQYINDLVKADCKYVLVNNVSADEYVDYLDEVPHSIRHYFVLQHIYNTYRPAVIADKKTLWIKDSLPVNTKPVFEKGFVVNGTSLQLPEVLSLPGKKKLLTFFSKNVQAKSNVVINNTVTLPVTFLNAKEGKAFVLLANEIYDLQQIRFSEVVDSFSVAVYDHFPDLYTRIPLHYRLKQLPYVLGQSPLFKKTGQALSLQTRQKNIVESVVSKSANSKGAALWFVLSNMAGKEQMLTVEYYKTEELLGTYEFLVKPGKQVSYLLQAASQPNWNLSKPDKIRIIAARNLQVEELHLVAKDELSY